MAQRLKEELRENIVMSAKEELKRNGYEGASMRRIAMGAGVSTGNLYRYFKNKDELLSYITQPALNAIDMMLKKESDDVLSLYETPVNIINAEYNHAEIRKQAIDTIDRMAEGLNTLLDEYYHELMISMMNKEEISGRFFKWFKSLITEYIPYFYNDDNHNIEDRELLYDILGESALCGMVYILKKREEMPEGTDFTRLLKTYVKLFLRL